MEWEFVDGPGQGLHFLHIKFRGEIHFGVMGQYGKRLLQGLQERDLTKALIDLREAEINLSDWDKFNSGVLVANLFSSDFEIAVLCRKEFIDKYLETVAINRLARLLITHDEEEARQWLQI